MSLLPPWGCEPLGHGRGDTRRGIVNRHTIHSWLPWDVWSHRPTSVYGHENFGGPIRVFQGCYCQLQRFTLYWFHRKCVEPQGLHQRISGYSRIVRFSHPKSPKFDFQKASSSYHFFCMCSRWYIWGSIDKFRKIHYFTQKAFCRFSKLRAEQLFDFSHEKYF